MCYVAIDENAMYLKREARYARIYLCEHGNLCRGNSAEPVRSERSRGGRRERQRARQSMNMISRRGSIVHDAHRHSQHRRVRAGRWHPGPQLLTHSTEAR